MCVLLVDLVFLGALSVITLGAVAAVVLLALWWRAITARHDQVIRHARGAGDDERPGPDKP